MYLLIHICINLHIYEFIYMYLFIYLYIFIYIFIYLLVFIHESPKLRSWLLQGTALVYGTATVTIGFPKSTDSQPAARRSDRAVARAAQHPAG